MKQNQSCVTEKDCREIRHEKDNKICTALAVLEDKIDKIIKELTTNTEKTKRTQKEFDNHTTKESETIKNIYDKLDDISKSRVTNKVFYTAATFFAGSLAYLLSKLMDLSVAISSVNVELAKIQALIFD